MPNNVFADAFKYNIAFQLKGPKGTSWVPNKTNPVGAESLEEVAYQLADGMPLMFGGVKVVGFRVTEIE